MSRLLKYIAIFYAALLFVALAEDQIVGLGCWIHEEWEKRL